MPRFSGPQYPGAMKDYRKDQRAAAEARQAASLARAPKLLDVAAEGFIEGSRALGKVAAALAAIVFPEPTAAQREGNATRHTRSRRSRRAEG